MLGVRLLNSVVWQLMNYFVDYLLTYFCVFGDYCFFLDTLFAEEFLDACHVFSVLGLPWKEH